MMAIKINYETEYGVTIENAYVVIDSFQYHKNYSTDAEPGISLITLAKIFGNEEARDSGKPAVESYGFVFDIDTKSIDNYIIQAYKALKAKSTFIKSEDC